MRRAVFLDRDGTINVDHGFVSRLDELDFMPGAVEALSLLAGAGFVLVVVTNQSGVARGYFTECDVRAFHDEMNRRLGEKGVRIDRFYYCPHHPGGVVAQYRCRCQCRKPGNALFVQAIADLDIDPKRSFAIGDNVTDLQPAVALGATGVLISDQDTPAPTGEASGFPRVGSLLHAVRLLLGRG